jgi:hypothetical protein
MKEKSQTTVVNVNKERHDVYIGRGSKWGNPFKIGPDGSRITVIKKYKSYIEDKIKFNNLDLSELKGKRLGCHCAPLKCHGDVLKKMVDELCQ